MAEFGPEEAEVVTAQGFTRVDQLRARHWLAFVGPGVVVARADGSDLRSVFAHQRHRGGSDLLAWSPDGRTLYHPYDQVYAIDVATGEARAITALPPGESIHALWFFWCSPGNRTLLFLQSLPEPGNSFTHRICTLGADGSSTTAFEPFDSGLPWLLDVNWQRDLIVAEVPVRWGADIWRMDVTGRNRVRVATLPHRIHDLALSPDGTRLAMVLETGIWLFDLARQEWTGVAGAGTNLAWSPDGKAMAFMNDESELWLVRLEGEKPEFTALAWVAGRKYSFRERGGSYAVKPVWSPDGRLLWFAIARRRRVRPDPRLVRRIEKRDFSHVPEAQRAQARASSLRHLEWKSTLFTGMVDFAERQVCLTESYRYRVAWSPRLEAPVE